MAEGFGNEAGLAGHEQHSARRGEERMTVAENSKSQTPSPKKIPNPKFQFSVALVVAAFVSAQAAESQTRAGTKSAAATNQVQAQEPGSTEKDYAKLQSLDDAAQAEVEKWRQENQELKARGAGTSEEELKQRIEKRLEIVRKAYEDFLGKHPD